MKDAKEVPPTPPIQVYGLMLVVRIEKGPGERPEVMCPKGGATLYGTVTATGDGFDAEAKTFRKMPKLGDLITFEESGETVEGHYFYVGRQEFRVVHLDAVILSFPISDDGAL